MNYTTPYDASEISLEMPVTEVIASLSSGTSWRYYFYPEDDGHYSQWLNLTEGEHYYT